MKIHAERKPLLEAFALAASVAKKSTTKPILRHVLMVATEGGTSLVATDLDLYVRVPVSGCVVREPGRAVLDGERVGAALASYPDDSVRIETDGPKVLIAGAKSKSSLTSDDPDLFPAMPAFPESAPAWSILPSDLAIMEERTAFAADPKSTKYALGGCLVVFREAAVRMVGTDGRRLSLMATPHAGQSSDIKAILPTSALAKAGKVFGKEGGPISLAFSGPNAMEPSVAHFRGQSGELASRLVEGRYPRYEDVIPGEWSSVARMSAGAFLSAIECAAIVASEETRGVDLAFSPGSLVVSAVAADRGESEATIDVEYDGKPVGFRLDNVHLRECLKRIDPAATLSIRLIDGDSSVVLTLEDGFLHILQPLTVAKP